jgi:hypothetical protein
MLIKLTQLNLDFRGTGVGLSEVYINPEHIVSVTESGYSDKSLQEVSHLVEIDARFSKIIINEGGNSRTVTVVGAPHEIYTKINKRQVLRG